VQEGGVGRRRVWSEEDWHMPIRTLLRAETTMKPLSSSGGGGGGGISSNGGECWFTTTSKDGQVKRFLISYRFWKKLQDYYSTLLSLAQNESSAFAYDYYEGVVAEEKKRGGGESAGKDRGPFQYSLVEEYQRLGLHDMEGLQAVKQWEFQPAFCDSYPEVRW